MKLLPSLRKRISRDVSAGLILLLMLTPTLLAPVYLVLPAAAQAYEGFGAETLGGEGQPLYQVTNLNDSGPGSLRDALSAGNRHIVFEVGGEILLESRLYVQGANITIDGFTAPEPGITLKNYGLRIAGGRGAHDVIVSGIRVHIISEEPGAEDGIAITSGAYNIVVDHVSIRGASDESIGLNNVEDVTVSWSILAEPINSHDTNVLITNRARRLSIHHNLFIQATRRNPWIAWVLARDLDPTQTQEAPEIQADVRNNLMWDVSGSGSDHGSVVFGGGKANITDNYYKAMDGINEAGQKRVIVICKESGITSEDMAFCQSRLEFPPARVYVAGNVSADGWTEHINTKGTEAGPFPAPFVNTTDACTAAHAVLADAGVSPLDPVEQQYLSTISLPPCAGEDPTVAVAPSQLDFAVIQGDPNPPPQSVTVTDSNSSGISWNIIDTGPSWLSVTPQNGTTPSELNVAVSSSSLPIGTHTGSFNIEAPGASNSPITILVNLTVSAPDDPPEPPPSPNAPTITSPNPGSVLPGSTVTFEWTDNGENVKKWRLYVGTSQGANDLYDSGKLGGSTDSHTVPNLPTDGQTIWVQLRSRINGTWQSADFQYTGAIE